MRTLIRLTSCLASLNLLFATGCWAPVHEVDMTGHFAMNSKWACGTLQLNADHTFHQELSKGCTTERLDITGRWEVDVEHEMAVAISFRPFLARNPDNDQVGSFAWTDFTVNKLKWTGVRIVIDPDASIMYEKSSSK